MNTAPRPRMLYNRQPSTAIASSNVRKLGLGLLSYFEKDQETSKDCNRRRTKTYLKVEAPLW